MANKKFTHGESFPPSGKGAPPFLKKIFQEIALGELKRRKKRRGRQGESLAYKEEEPLFSSQPEEPLFSSQPRDPLSVFAGEDIYSAIQRKHGIRPDDGEYGGDPILDEPVPDYISLRELSSFAKEGKQDENRFVSQVRDHLKANTVLSEEEARSERPRVDEGFGRSVDPRTIHDSGEWYRRRLNPDAYYSDDPRLEKDTVELENEMRIRDQEQMKAAEEAAIMKILGMMAPGAGK